MYTTYLYVIDWDNFYIEPKVPPAFDSEACKRCISIDLNAMVVKRGPKVTYYSDLTTLISTN